MEELCRPRACHSSNEQRDGQRTQCAQARRHHVPGTRFSGPDMHNRNVGRAEQMAPVRTFSTRSDPAPVYACNDITSGLVEMATKSETHGAQNALYMANDTKVRGVCQDRRDAQRTRGDERHPNWTGGADQGKRNAQRKERDQASTHAGNRYLRHLPLPLRYPNLASRCHNRSNPPCHKQKTHK